MKSTTEHKRAGIKRSCFSMVHFAKMMVIRNNSGALMYAYLYGNMDLDWRIGKAMMSVSMREFKILLYNQR